MKLARHTLLNLLGLGIPLLAAVATIPPLVAALGPERFGLLTLVWALASYFGLFDLGLARALTQQLAVALERRDDARVGPLCATTLLLMAGLGLLAGAAMLAAAPWAVDAIKGLPDRAQALEVVHIVGLMMPAIVLTAGLRGILEACHAFAAINAVRVPMGLWTFGGPWLVVQWAGPDLTLIAWALLAGRALGCLAHAVLAWRALPLARRGLRWRRELLRPLLNSGGWLTLSNVVSPFMGYVDRFLIGATLSAAAVAFYATPQEIVTKLWIVPSALTTVLLPTFAAQLARADAAVWQTFDRSVATLFLLLLPVTAALALFAGELLGWWLDPAFAAQSAPVLRIFAIGILINCLAHVPTTALHGAGRFRATALLHCIELPLFIAALWLLTAWLGLVGAALAWLLRMSFDTLALFALCARQRGAAPRWQDLTPGAALAAAAFAGAAFEALPTRALWLALVLAAAATIGARQLRSLRS